MPYAFFSERVGLLFTQVGIHEMNIFLSIIRIYIYISPQIRPSICRIHVVIYLRRSFVSKLEVERTPSRKGY